MIFRKGDKVAWVQGDKIVAKGKCSQKSQDKNRRNEWTILTEDDILLKVLEKELRHIQVIVKKPV